MTKCVFCKWFTRRPQRSEFGVIGDCKITLPPWMTAGSNDHQPIYSEDATCDLGVGARTFPA